MVVEETSLYNQKIAAPWRISCTEGFFHIGPKSIANALTNGYVGRNCHGRNCKSLNGFRSVLVKGERVMWAMSDGANGTSQEPIIRVLLENPAAIWVALSQSSMMKPKSNDFQGVLTILQGSQCISCCLTSAMKRLELRDPSHKYGRAYILTCV